MCQKCGQPSFIICNCLSQVQSCENCIDNAPCPEKMDQQCGIYHFGNPYLPSLLINLNLPNGSSAQTIFEKIDSIIGTIAGNPISVTSTNAINITATGPGHKHLTASLVISEEEGNLAEVTTSGLTVLPPTDIYKVKVDSSHFPHYLEDALIGGTDTIVSIEFLADNGVLFGNPSIDIITLISRITNDPELITILTNAILNTILDNPSFLNQLISAIETTILNDSSFMTALTQVILDNPGSFSLLCQTLNDCHFDCNCSGITPVNPCNDPIITFADSIISSTGGTSTLSVGYNDASPLPVGYIIYYRISGSSDPFESAGPFDPSNSPIVINGLPEGDYEGSLVSSCSDGSFSSGATFVTSGFYNVNITNSLPTISISNVIGISGFTFSGPVNVGDFDRGVHDGFTGAITIEATGVPSVDGKLVLNVNGILIQCIDIPNGSSVASEAFFSHTFDAGDYIDIAYLSGSC